jgi:signal transduction histidine kinase
MLALAWLLAEDVLTSTEQRLAGEAQQECLRAADELSDQYRDWEALRAEPADPLPFEALDLSLRGMTLAVLRPYQGLSGGFYVAGINRLAGSASPGAVEPARSPPDFERDIVLSVIEHARRDGGVALETRNRDRDVFVVAAQPAGGGAIAWTLKRLAGIRDPGLERRRGWLAGLVLATLLGVGGIISISLHLRRGLATVNAGLRRLQDDFSYRMPPIPGEFGDVAQAINNMADRRKALEVKLRQQDRLAALGKVVSGVAHEIRNPLNSLRLTLELLERRTRRGAARSDEIHEAIGEVDRLDQILGRLLAFGRPALDERRRQEVRPLVDRAVRLVQEQARSKSVVISTAYPDHDPVEAEVDGLQLEQVLINLLLNAIEASPPGQEVELSVMKREEQIEIRVRDHGAGIPASVAEHIFDPYFTTKETGNGLGLAVSREVVARHGGALEYEACADGAAFVVELPVRRVRP